VDRLITYLCSKCVVCLKESDGLLNKEIWMGENTSMNHLISSKPDTTCNNCIQCYVLHYTLVNPIFHDIYETYSLPQHCSFAPFATKPPNVKCPRTIRIPYYKKCTKILTGFDTCNLRPNTSWITECKRNCPSFSFFFVFRSHINFFVDSICVLLSLSLSL
jgi:hypothetical protein